MLGSPEEQSTQEENDSSETLILLPSNETNSNEKKSKRPELELSKAKIGFVGAGKIAQSIASGLINHSKIKAKQIYVSAKTNTNLKIFKKLGCITTKTNYDIFHRFDCDIVFLCFHGSLIKQCYKMGGSRPHPFTSDYIPNQNHPLYILSLVSGVTLDQIKACLIDPEQTQKYQIVMNRILLNSAVAYGCNSGLGAIDIDPKSKKLSPIIRQLLTSFSKLEHVPESQMDSVCTIAGNGMAIVYYFVGALANAAHGNGLKSTYAYRLAAKTARNAAETVLATDKEPKELRERYSAPSGAALYGMHFLEKANFASGIVAAIETIHKRAQDLAEIEFK
jgi:pyrroline-5-carboxylate reductase